METNLMHGPYHNGGVFSLAWLTAVNVFKD